MQSQQYQYMPATGPLPGTSFEAQTVEFLNALQGQIDQLSEKIGAIEVAWTNEITDIKRNLANLASQIGTINVAAQSARAMAEASRNEAGAAKNEAFVAQGQARAANEKAEENAKGVVPPGGIVISNGPLPTDATSWKKADGGNGTADLSRYASGDLSYIQRTE